MPDNILTVDGVNLFTTYGAYAFEREVWVTPEKDATFYSVPGRDGDILGVNVRMPDVEISYDIIITENADTNLQGLRNFLMSRNGRVRIEHDGDPGHFREGIFLGPFKPKLSKDRTQAKGVVTFRCQPQRWLTSGETSTVITAATDFTNPTLFTSKPLLRVTLASPLPTNTILDVSFGNGTPDYEYTEIYISNAIADEGVAYVDFDCETMQAYKGATNLAKYVSVSFRGPNDTTLNIADFPCFKAGTNRVSFPFGGSKPASVEVWPRWWEV